MLTYVFGAIGSLAALAVVLWVINPPAFGRIWAALTGQVGKAGRAAWGADPVAVYQQQVDDSAEEIREATRGLEQYRGLVARLERQVDNGDKEVARLTVRIKALLQSGDEDRAADLALQLKKTQNEVSENREQLAQYRETYENNLKKIRHAREKITEARARAHKLEAELRMSKADAEIAQLAQQVGVPNVSLDGLAAIEDEIQRQVDTNRAKSLVARDLSQGGLDEIDLEEREKKAEARAVLQQFKSELGLPG